MGEGDALSRFKITSWNPPRAAIQKINHREAGTRKRTKKSVTGQPSDGTRISGKTVEIERRFCPNGHGAWNMHVTPQQNPFRACEECQNNKNLGLDGRVDLENLDALMTPIGNDDDDPSLSSTKAPIQQEPHSCSLTSENPIGQRPDPQIKQSHGSGKGASKEILRTHDQRRYQFRLPNWPILLPSPAGHVAVV